MFMFNKNLLQQTVLPVHDHDYYLPYLHTYYINKSSSEFAVSFVEIYGGNTALITQLFTTRLVIHPQPSWPHLTTDDGLE